MTLLICVIAYLAMSVFIAGKSFAYWQRGWDKWLAEDDKNGDFWFSLFLGGIGWWVTIFWLLFRRQPLTGKRCWNNGWTLNYKNPRKKNLTVPHKCGIMGEK